MQRCNLPSKLFFWLRAEVNGQKSWLLHPIFHKEPLVVSCLRSADRIPSGTGGADHFRDRGQTIESSFIQVNVQRLCDHLCPAVEEVNPTVFDGQVSLLALGQRLVHKLEFTTVVQLPGDAIDGKVARIGDRRSGQVACPFP